MKQQPIADTYSVVKLSGHRASTLMEAYMLSAPVSRNRINNRTGEPWTIFRNLKGPNGEKNDFTLQFEMVRRGIRGNWPNDNMEFIEKAANKGRKNRRIQVEITRFKRTEW